LRYLRFLPTKCTAENPGIVDFRIHVKNDDGSYSFGGVVGISYIEEANRSGEAGVIVSPHLHRKGFGTEALYNVLKYAFEDRKLHRVTIETGEDNVSMCSWLEEVLNLYSILEWEWVGGIKKKLEKLVLHCI